MAAAILFAIAAAPALGQHRIHSWQKGPLTFDDFGTQQYAGQGTSHLDYDITHSTSGITEGINTYYYCHTSAIMHPGVSWIADGFRDTTLLVYNQALFDIVEIHSRQMQVMALAFSGKKQYAALHDLTLGQLERELNSIRAATNYGADSLAVERLRQANRKWLNNNPHTRPTFAPQSYWTSIGYDLGLAYPFGELGSQFSISLGTVNSIRFSMGRNRHSLHFMLSTGNTRSHNLSNALFSYPDQIYYWVNYGIHYGFAVVDRDRYRITPYIGIGVTGLEGEYNYYDGVTYTIGAMADYHLHRWHFMRRSTTNDKAYSITASATGNLYARYADNMLPGNMFTIGARVGLTIGFRKEKVSFD